MNSFLNMDDAAIEAELEAEDREYGRGEAVEVEAQADTDAEPEEEAEADSQETEPVAEEVVEAAAEESEATKPEEPAKPLGIASKDGKGLLPYAALKGARAETRRERDLRSQVESERDALKQQLEDLRAGKDPEAGEITEEYLQGVEADFPALIPLIKTMRATSKEVETLRAKATQVTVREAETEDDPVQEAIDSVPLLAEWQAADPEKWERAKAIDRAFEGSPKWKDKPLAARFAHVAKQVADEFDIKSEADTPPLTTPTKPRQDPEKAIQSAKRAAPNTMSDFKGGSADSPDLSIDKMPANRQLSHVMKLSDAEIEAWLAKSG